MSAAMLVQTAGVAPAYKTAEWGLPAFGGGVVKEGTSAPGTPMPSPPSPARWTTPMPPL